MLEKNMLFLGMVVATGFASPALADWISQDAQYDFQISPGAHSFQEYMGGFFDPFDDQGGHYTLERVVLSYSINASADVTVENHSDEGYGPWLCRVGFSTSLEIDRPHGPSPAEMSGLYEAELGASDGIAGSGPDFHDFGTLSLEAHGYWETTSASDLAKFASSDPVDYDVVFDGRAQVELVEGMVDLDVSNLAASMNARLTYEYSVVPEPTTLLLFTLGSLGLIRKRE